MAILFKGLFFLSLLYVPCFAGKRDGDDTQKTVLGFFEGGDKYDHDLDQFNDEHDLDQFNDEHDRGMSTPEGNNKPDLETNFLGSWKLDSPNAGVAAMQMQLMPNNKLVWFDTTALGDSAIKLNPPGNCPMNFEKNYADCFAHAITYDIETAEIVPLKIDSDPWCSSGGLAPNGDLVNTGGFNKGVRAVRIISPCDTCEFKENNIALSANRWYSSNQILEDGSFLVVGGRRSYNYEIIPTILDFNINQYGFPFLMETTDKVENNLFPFVYLLPTGDVFVFANNRAVIINPRTGKTVRSLPNLPGGSRNYPASGQSVLLPLELDPANNPDNLSPEVIVCGGNSRDAFEFLDGKPEAEKVYKPALRSCGRLQVLKEGAKWEIEQMPSPRVMGDMLLLPNGHVLLINGAKAGTAAWWSGDLPNFTPVLYFPNYGTNERFKELTPTNIARMYHSASAVLPSGQVLVAGSNPNDRYNFQIKYPTELRVEKFDPPYLDPALNKFRPEIIPPNPQLKLKYGQNFNLQIKLDVQDVEAGDLKVTIYFPPFTTHGYSQNQRLLVLPVTLTADKTQISAVAPPDGKVAPPGYYLLYVVHRAVPSKGIWVTIG